MASWFGDEDSAADHPDRYEIEVNFRLNWIITYSYEPTAIHDHKRDASRSNPTVDGAEHVSNSTW